jgi:hypothetical protein
MELKCNICNRLLPTDNFHKCNSISRGYQYKCKTCVTAYDKTVDRLAYQKSKVKDWRESNPEKRNEQKKRHYLKNKEKIDQKAKDWYNNNKDRSKANAILRKYGISIDDFNQMRESQQYRCAICGQGEEKFAKGLFIDHCHKTGKVRKLLCANCNAAIGMLQDDPRLLMIAAEYIKEFNG